MRILVDTNVFLEVLLAQANAPEAEAFLKSARDHDLFMSDYTLHSIGLLLLRRGLPSVFRQFLADLITSGAVAVVSIAVEEMEGIIHAATTFHLDFDDAYQYVAADRYDLAIVSYDADFDRTPKAGIFHLGCADRKPRPKHTETQSPPEGSAVSASLR